MVLYFYIILFRSKQMFPFIAGIIALFALPVAVISGLVAIISRLGSGAKSKAYITSTKVCLGAIFTLFLSFGITLLVGFLEGR